MSARHTSVPAMSGSIRSSSDQIGLTLARQLQPVAPTQRGEHFVTSLTQIELEDLLQVPLVFDH